MPIVRPSDPERPRVLAILTGDWHCWDTPPSYRSDEPDWWAAQERPINQIKALQNKYHGVPILHGGDVFDRWKASPELINWALKHFPVMYSIAGNHDLPNHRYEEIYKSAYWTLVEAGRLINIEPGYPHPLDGLTIHGFPFGTPIKPFTHSQLDSFAVALTHGYIWKKNHGYTGAPDDKRVGEWERKLSSFQFACFSDNHSAFTHQVRNTAIINMGCTMRRRRDESSYQPRVYLLWSDNEISEKKLDLSEDVYTDKGEETVDSVKIQPEKLIKSLKGLQTKCKIDFQETCKEIMMTMGVEEEIRCKVMEAIQEDK